MNVRIQVKSATKINKIYGFILQVLPSYYICKLNLLVKFPVTPLKQVYIEGAYVHL